MQEQTYQRRKNHPHAGEQNRCEGLCALGFLFHLILVEIRAILEFDPGQKHLRRALDSEGEHIKESRRGYPGQQPQAGKQHACHKESIAEMAAIHRRAHRQIKALMHRHTQRHSQRKGRANAIADQFVSGCLFHAF